MSKVIYEDINDGKIQRAEFHEYDYVTNHVIVKLKDGTLLRLTPWQVIHR